MPSFNGTVEAISIKELPQEDKYGNVYRASIKLGEDWYSWGSLKRDSISIRQGSGWHTLSKGDSLEGMYKQNGDFKNIQPKTVSVTDEAPQQNVPKKSTSSPKKGDYVPKPNVNPASRGQAMNLAAHVLGYSAEDMLDKTKVYKAIKWYQETCDFFDDNWEKALQDVTVEEESEEDFIDEYDDSDV